MMDMFRFYPKKCDRFLSITEVENTLWSRGDLYYSQLIRVALCNHWFMDKLSLELLHQSHTPWLPFISNRKDAVEQLEFSTPEEFINEIRFRRNNPSDRSFFRYMNAIMEGGILIA